MPSREKIFTLPMRDTYLGGVRADVAIGAKASAQTRTIFGLMREKSSDGIRILQEASPRHVDGAYRLFFEDYLREEISQILDFLYAEDSTAREEEDIALPIWHYPIQDAYTAWQQREVGRSSGHIYPGHFVISPSAADGSFEILQYTGAPLKEADETFVRVGIDSSTSALRMPFFAYTTMVHKITPDILRENANELQHLRDPISAHRIIEMSRHNAEISAGSADLKKAYGFI